MTPPGHWPGKYRYRSSPKRVGATGRPRSRTRRPGGVIPKIAPNDPATDGGSPPDPRGLHLPAPADEPRALHLPAPADGPGGLHLPAALDGPGSGYSLLFDANPSAMWVYDCETLRMLA